MSRAIPAKVKQPVHDKKNFPRGLARLAGREVTYTVRVSNRAKNLRLQVSLEAGLEIICPKNFNLVNLGDVLQAKQKWILDKLDYFLKQEGSRDGWGQGKNRVFYRGREYEVETRVERDAARKAVTVEESKLVVTLPEGSEGQAEAVLERWFRSMARLLIHQRIRVINKDLNLSYNKVFIKNQKTRWGSCSQRKNLNFNWRLVMAPLPVLDYIVVHELVHLVEMNHSQSFWAKVEEICPDYRAHRAWLRKNGSLLTLP